MSPDDLLTIREAAKYLRLGTSTVYRYAESGELEGQKLRGSGQWRFRRSACDALLEAPPARRKKRESPMPQPRRQQSASSFLAEVVELRRAS